MAHRNLEAERTARRDWVLTAVEQYEQRLVRFAARLLGEEEAARDIVQHAFLQLCRQSPEKAAELGTGDSVGHWLFCVARRRAYDVLRKRQREPATNDEFTAESMGLGDGPADVTEQRELGELLLGLVDRLPDAQRESVLLWAEGFTSSEIGEITSRNATTVRVHLHKAFAALREHPQVRRLQIEEERSSARVP